MVRPGPKPKGRVKREWSINMAYAVGLLTSDGSLSKDGRHINFTSKDEDQIITFQDCLELHDIKIGRKSNGSVKEKKYFQVQFGDVLFYRWLVLLGLSPDKSKTLGKVSVPDEYFFDFLRGCFDGDGCIYGYWDHRWKSSYMFYVSITSASPLFLVWLQDKIYSLTGARGYISKGKKSAQDLRFAKKEGRIVFEKMFYSRKVPYLERKFAKAQKIFTIDKDYSKNAQVEKLVDSHP